MSIILYFRYASILLLVQHISAFNACGQEFTFSLGTKDVVINNASVPIFPWFPDGHITILPGVSTDDYIMYWSGHESYRTHGTRPFPEFQTTLTPNENIFGGRRNIERWDNGGSWLMSVFRQEGNNLVGFYHAEDHWDRSSNPEGIAWKSIARTTSADDGMTWTEGEQIITSPKSKPENPTWGGSGDHCVIWDAKENRWLCYYQEHWLMMAISDDVDGKPGSWKKYYNGEFNQPGLGGESSAIPGLSSKPGGNPSVHYNSYLEKYIIVWHSWTSTSIYISTSDDGINWEEPRLLEPNTGSRRAWYPTIIGESDTQAGKIARLYYADIAPGFTSREFVSKALVFDKKEHYQPQMEWQHQRIGVVPVLGLMDESNDNTLRMVTFSGSIEDTENIGYYYKDKDGSYLISGKFYLDEFYNEGSIGLSIRSGLNSNDAMAGIVFNTAGLTFISREKDGEVNLKEGNSIEWTSDFAWLQVEKSSGSVTCRYSSDGEDWTDIGNIPFEKESSKAGMFITGYSDRGVIAYIEELEETTQSTSTTESSGTGNTTIYSNPSKGRVFIHNPELYTHFAIYNLNGQLEINGVIDSNFVDVQKLTPGLYVINLHRSKLERPISGKLIIAK